MDNIHMFCFLIICINVMALIIILTSDSERVNLSFVNPVVIYNNIKVVFCKKTQKFFYLLSIRFFLWYNVVKRKGE